MLDPGNQKVVPFAGYQAELTQFNAKAGPVRERRVVAITWTKDPAQAPAPGVYAAIDVVSRYANVDRHCGYVVLYQRPLGGDFQITREEQNYLDNATAAMLTKQKGSFEVERAWAALFAHCPNYPRPTPPPLPEQPDSNIGYPSVAAALANLKRRPGVNVSTKDGWTVIADNAAMTFWSFSPPGYSAYPAAVKREVKREGGAFTLQMSILCEASKAACDDLVRTYEALNAQMKAQLQGRR